MVIDFLNNLREVELFEVEKYLRLLEYILIVFVSRPNNK